jgi:hypothetical protein
MLHERLSAGSLEPLYEFQERVAHQLDGFVLSLSSRGPASADPSLAVYQQTLVTRMRDIARIGIPLRSVNIRLSLFR